MNKRIFLLVLIILFVLQGWALAAPVTIIAPDGQSQVGVINNALDTAEKTRKIATKINSYQFYVGSCRLKSVNMFSSAAGDYISVYDTATAPDGSAADLTILEFEIGISANNSSNSYDAKGAQLYNGIYVKSSSATTLITVSYDY